MKTTNYYLPLLGAMSLSTLLLFSSCNKEATQSQQALQSGAAKVAGNTKATILVHAGESIQAAVDAAAPGTIIKIDPGTYLECIMVNKPGIQLIGTGKDEAGVVIKNPGDDEDGIMVNNGGDGFVVKNITVENFEENGVWLDSVDNFIISHVTTIDNGEYGIFPLHSSHGSVDHCTASGHTDTGIYIGQSTDVNMDYNTAYANVNGLEVENASNISVTHNQSYNNVCGILVSLLPGLDVKTASDIIIAHNHVYDNNHENFGEEGEGLESVVPPGLGILVLGADHTTVDHNTVMHNDFAGITVFSSLVLVALGGADPSDFDIEPNPEGTRVINNVVQQNGANPPVLDIPLPGVDLLWDGSGTDNCWSDNVFKTSYPSPLPSCN